MRDVVFVLAAERSYEGQEVLGAYLTQPAARAAAEVQPGFPQRDYSITEWHGDEMIYRWFHDMTEAFHHWDETDYQEKAR